MQVGRRSSTHRDRLHRRLASLTLCCALGFPLACTPLGQDIALLGPLFGAGNVVFVVTLGLDPDAESLQVELDGEPVSVQPGHTPRIWLVDTEVGPGTHTITASVSFDQGAVDADAEAEFTTPIGAPPLLDSEPADGAEEVLHTAWLRLDFEQRIPRAALRSFELDCDGASIDLAAVRLAPAQVVLNPSPEMPSDADCTLAWRGQPQLRAQAQFHSDLESESFRETLSFSTAAAGALGTVRYDRSDLTTLAPYPDDYWTEPDATTLTGIRLSVPAPDREIDVRRVLKALRAEANELDGFSPIGHLTFELSDALDPDSIPQTPSESLDPLASAALLDLDPESPSYGKRIPFRMEARDDTTGPGVQAYSAWVFPSIPLRPKGVYGFVLTSRAATGPGRPFLPSGALAASFASAVPGEDASTTRVRELLEPLLEVAEQITRPPIPREDMTLALRFTVRSLQELPNDMLSIREDVWNAPPPTFQIDSVDTDIDDSRPLHAVVRGTWLAPDWRDGEGCKADGLPPGSNFERGENGLPVQTRSCEIPFTLGLPEAALLGPVPILMYQHGNPGSSENEVPSSSRDHLYEAGFAVLGFTDILNREISEGEEDSVTAIELQTVAIIAELLENRKIADFWAQTNAEQLAFLRMLSSLGSLDLLPAGAPDGEPELDPELPIGYVGISQGSNHAPAFLAYAPEIRAAALVVGGARLAEILLHQQAGAFLNSLPLLFPNVTPVDIWMGLALFQAAFDRQDAHNHARFLYRDPVLVDGTTRKASLLVTEGLDDSLVANHATESLAWQIGPIPFLEPVQRDVPFLDKVTGPVEGNIDEETTAAFYQYVPQNVDGISPTPGCVPPEVSERTANEGHYCAQSAAEARLQRDIFLESALEPGAPTIIDPLAP